MVKAVLAVIGLLVVGVMAFAIFEPVQVLPRIRLAPGFALVDQSGSPFTSEDGKGMVTLYAFAPSNCGRECESIYETMSEVGERVTAGDLAESQFRMVTVALDTDEPGELREAAAGSGADGDTWRWAGGDETVLREVVGRGFRVYFDTSDPAQVEFDPTFIIVDGTGLIRGEYSYSSLVSDADRLTRHISLLGNEIRNAEGGSALIYEAAHIFLCYP